MDDAAGPRRFSIQSAIVPKYSDVTKWGSISQVDSENTALLEGSVKEYTSLRKEAVLLFNYSLPLTLTYLLQVGLLIAYQINQR